MIVPETVSAEEEGQILVVLAPETVLERGLSHFNQSIDVF